MKQRPGVVQSWGTPRLSWFLDGTAPHWRQGDIDGCCGVYCVAMVLDYWGLADPLCDMDDGRRSLPRFLKRVCQEDPLLRNGSTCEQLARVTQHYRGLSAEKLPLGRDQTSNFARIEARVAHEKIPVILSYAHGEGGHWVVVTGAGVWEGKPTLFALCPGTGAACARGGTLFNEYLLLAGPKRGWKSSDGSAVRPTEALAVSLN